MPLSGDPEWQANLAKLTCNVGVFSSGIYKNKEVVQLLGSDNVVYRPSKKSANHLSAIVGWGNKPNTEKARKYAEISGLAFIALEDGWVRSLSDSGHWARSLSLVRDDLGIYYDASKPSRLEKLIAETSTEDAVNSGSARLRKRLIDLKVSKYNKYRTAPTLEKGKKVLVVDQTRGDLSIKGASASANTFGSMLDYALDKHSDAKIYIKVHPDVVSGKKRGHFDLNSLPSNVELLSEGMNPIALLSQFDHVHVVSSQLGFEALMLGVPVTCHGLPFYSGWGLTHDLCTCSRRGIQKTLDEVFHAVYLEYCIYLNPATSEQCSLDELLDFLETQFIAFDRNDGDQYCVGFRYWKRYIARAYLGTPENKVTFTPSMNALQSNAFKENDSVVIWANRDIPEIVEHCNSIGTNLRRMEDGFFRSVGLGSDFFAPVSLVIDSGGIYYNPEKQSDLERILATYEFSNTELKQAELLRQQVIRYKVSKYNLKAEEKITESANGRLKILVPGQVEDDASVKLGGGDIQNNLELLKAVKAANPGAYIVYKPHPDVLSGNRKNHSKTDELMKHCDQYLRNADIEYCIAWCDEVHTLTSLTGFEALMRGKKVVTYGRPFYAGWGLSLDIMRFESRGRQRSLGELIAAVLLIYPLYYDWDSRCFITASQAVSKLKLQRDKSVEMTGSSLPLIKHGIIKGRQLLNIFRYS